MKTLSTWLLLSISYYELGSSRLLGIPTVPFSMSLNGHFNLSDLVYVTVDSHYAQARDEKGATLVPPSLREFASTFADDLGSVGIKVDVAVSDEARSNSIWLTLDDDPKYHDAAGAETSEGYSLTVSPEGIVISGASPLGVWWGTRTVLQQVILSNTSLPYGSGVDAPGWSTRGMMLDAGRHYYPPEFLKDICAYMSFFKQNTFHVHLSDNLNVNTDLYTREFTLDLFARFRLWSDSAAVAGLNKYKNESYTREQFDDIQASCAARGVTVLPEIEAPGHALVIVQWKPELGLSSDLSLLNISHPETIPTMKTIWHEFLPWFHTKTVSIGADEYTAGVDAYNYFVNEMDAFIYEDSGKSTRIWGTYPPNTTYQNIYKNVSIQHWEFYEDNPLFDYILNNYSVLNSDDAYYIVNKWSASYPQTINITKTFHGNPTGGFWYPYIFDMTNATNNPEKSNRYVLGEIAALWNDYGQNASVVREAYYAWKQGIPALSDKQWGGDLSETEFPAVYSSLQPKTPGQNLDRSIPSKSSTILNYTISSSNSKQNKIMDTSGNGYDAFTSCPTAKGSFLAISPSCTLHTPFGSKGHDYTLSLRIRVDELIEPTNATILAGTDSALMLTPNITLFDSGNYYRLNSSIALGSWVDLSIIGKGNQTFASATPLLDGRPVGLVKEAPESQEEFLAILGVLGEYRVWAPVAIEAPLSQLGGLGCGWKGELATLILTSDANW